MKTPRHPIATIILSALMLATPVALADVLAVMQVPDIEGESQRANYEGWIDLTSFHYPVQRDAAANQRRARSAPIVGPVEVGKYGDAASVYLNLATLQGRFFNDVIVDILTDTGDSLLVQFRYEFDGVQFVAYDSSMTTGEQRVDETLGFIFETVRVIYTRQNDDQSGGDQEEIEYDVSLGQ